MLLIDQLDYIQHTTCSCAACGMRVSLHFPACSRCCPEYYAPTDKPPESPHKSASSPPADSRRTDP